MSYLLQEREAGRDPSTKELEARFPFIEDRIEEARSDVRRYMELRRALRSTDVEETPRPAPGTVVGGFEVQGEIARGGMGVVYRARQLALGGREVALKIGLRHRVSPTARARFEREARLLADLHHPNLAEVYGFGEENGCAYLAMQLVSGPNLHGVLARRRGEPPSARRPDLERRVRLVQGVAGALSEVHRRGLIHRDVKPTNVVLEGAREEDPLGTATRAVLVDFGLVRPVLDSSATSTRGSPATFEYASPEQMLGEELDARTDVFSLGALLHDLLAGRLPEERLQASAGLELLSTVIEGVDADLAAIVGKACDPDKRWRYPSAIELEADLSAWLAGRGVSARHASLLQRTRRWLGRHPTTVIRASGSLLGLLLLLWAGITMSDWVDAWNRITTGWRGGDPLGVSVGLDRLPFLVQRAGGLVWTPIREARKRFAALPADDPLPRIVLALDEEDPGLAFHLATRRIARVGLGGDPFLDRFFVAGLDVSNGRKPNPQAALLMGRFFYETPALSVSAMEASRSLREAARTILALGDPTEEALFASTALGGCGEARDLILLIEKCFGPSASRESTRLGMMSASVLLSRGPACGFLEELDLDALEAQVEPLARERFSVGSELASGMNFETAEAIDHVVVAIAIARRLRQESMSLDAWLGLDDLPRGRSTGGAGAFLHRTVCRLFAIVEDRRIISRLLPESERRGFEPAPPGEWGFLCGLFGDEETERQAREALDHFHGRAGIEAFEAGLARGAARIRGTLPTVEVDEETLLASRPSPLSAGVLWECQSIPEREFEGVLDIATDWIAGSGSLVRARSYFVDHEGDHLRFFLAGDSRLDLEFRTRVADHGDDFQIVIGHQAADRHPMPWTGDVVLEVDINGTLVGRFRVTSGGRRSLSLPVSSTVLQQTRAQSNAVQELSIRMHRESTTTYWLHSVGIVRAE